MFAIFVNANAQINLTLAFNSRPQPYLADWSNSINGRAIITVQQATGNTTTAVKFKTTLANADGTVIGTTNVATATVYNLRLLPTTNVFSLGDVLQLQNMQFISPVQNLLQRSGRLAAGSYKITVQILNEIGALVTEKMSVLNCTAYQLPTIISPANDAELDAHVASNIIIFRWTRLIPVTQEIPRYRVQVFEVLNSQTPMQAFRSNAPLLNEEAVKGATQYIWRSNLSMMDTTANRRFIWTLQTLDFNGQPIPTSDNNLQGRSEPAVFKIIHQNIDREKFIKKEVVN